ncbi:MAG: hypothetical protein AB1782_06660 [Cyanobacteriota bacterium]
MLAPYTLARCQSQNTITNDAFYLCINTWHGFISGCFVCAAGRLRLWLPSAPLKSGWTFKLSLAGYACGGWFLCGIRLRSAEHHKG